MPDNELWTVQRTLSWCTEYLDRHGDEHPSRSAEWLMSAATGMSRVELYAYYDKPLSMAERDVLRESLRRRGAGEPLQYVTGEAAFRHIIVRTAPGVLIPRPETELLVELALEHARSQQLEDPRVLEVGCGTGCVALSLAKECPARVVATDISAQAVACALRNAEALELSDHVQVVQTDCVKGVEGPFDMLVSNPPYIPSAVVAGLDREVVGYEPHLALDGGEDGLDFFNRLLAEACGLLSPGGLFACELHETCLDEALARARAAGLKEAAVHRDLAGKPRFLTARA
ncbi:MAG: peptide chain release factor N(5)-glutamine methyltransferase [Coriobacteriales bacterium]